MIADPGYDDKKLYEYSKRVLGINLVCPLLKDIKVLLKRDYQTVFRIDPLPARRFHKVSAIVLISVLLLQLMVYYNCKTEKINPKSIKYMLGAS
jgi:hypothetical protein